MLLKKIVKIHGKKMKTIDTKIDNLESMLDTFASLNLENVNDLISALRPAIGDIEINVTGTNPATKYPGTTWVAWGSGRVPVGIDTAQTEFDTVEKTDGAKTHTLTVSQMPAHTHTGKGYALLINKADSGGDGLGMSFGAGSYNRRYVSTTNSVGSGKAHNNLQPYITCYMWKRTA